IRAGESDELGRQAGVRHRVPGRERAIEGGLRLLRRHAGDVAVRDQVPDRERVELRVDDAAADARAQLQVRVSRRRTHDDDDGDEDKGVRPINYRPPGGAAITGSTADRNDSKGSGFLVTSPRTTGTALPLDRPIRIGVVTMRRPLRASATTRNAPWLR